MWLANPSASIHRSAHYLLAAATTPSGWPDGVTTQRWANIYHTLAEGYYARMKALYALIKYVSTL